MFWLEFNFGHVGRHHWSLIVICNPGEVVNINGEFYSHVLFKYFLLNIFILRYYVMMHISDKEPEKSLRLPCILHMDSIQGHHNGLKDLVQRYFWASEWHFHALNFLLFFNLNVFVLLLCSILSVSYIMNHLLKLTVICLKNGKRGRRIHMEKTSHQDSWICTFSRLGYVLLTF